MTWPSRRSVMALGALVITLSTSALQGGIAASATTALSPPSSACSPTDDFATGGGWLLPATRLNRTFGFEAGIGPNAPFFGQLVYINHNTKERVEGRVVFYGPGPTSQARHMVGHGEVNGELTDFEVDVTDRGEPGTEDFFRIRYETAAGVKIDGGTLGGGNIQIHPICIFAADSGA